MESEEIILRIKKHSIFLKSIEPLVQDKEICQKAQKYMELLFFELLKEKSLLLSSLILLKNSSALGSPALKINLTPDCGGL